MPDSLDDALMHTLTAGADAAARERAFRELVRRHAGELSAVLRCLLPTPADVEDVLQETFLRVYTARERYVPGRAPFGAWLHRIARNVALDARRRGALRAAEPLDPAGAPGREPAPPDALSARARAERLRAAVLRLPPDDREAVLLRYDLGLGYEAIAARTGASAAAVKQRVYRARARLRALLEDRPSGEEPIA